MKGVHGTAENLLLGPGGLVDHRHRGRAGIAARQKLGLKLLGQAGAEKQHHGSLVGSQCPDGFPFGHGGAPGSAGDNNSLAHIRQGVLRFQCRGRSAEGTDAGADIVGNPPLFQFVKLLPDGTINAGIAGVEPDGGFPRLLRRFHNRNHLLQGHFRAVVDFTTGLAAIE